jgi:ubiquinone/menaquinone biosynthesis C-methylase UbiE
MPISRPYERIAPVYDAVMDHVDYDRWARYVHQAIETHGDSVSSVLELGGGTGSLALRLQPMGPYDYTLTDGSAAMVEEARRKLEAAGRQVRCATAQFTDVDLDGLARTTPFDAAVLVYDGLNYLTERAEVAACLRRIADLLRSGGIAVVDHATPANSEDHDQEFHDQGSTGGVSYVRHSRYDADSGLHHTTFEVAVGGRHYREEHVQRPYTPATLAEIIRKSPLTACAAYDGFTFNPAHERSHRVHWVLEAD